MVVASAGTHSMSCDAWLTRCCNAASVSFFCEQTCRHHKTPQRLVRASVRSGLLGRSGKESSACTYVVEICDQPLPPAVVDRQKAVLQQQRVHFRHSVVPQAFARLNKPTLLQHSKEKITKQTAIVRVRVMLGLKLCNAKNTSQPTKSSNPQKVPKPNT